MTITMSYKEYNRMQEFAKQFVAKNGGARPTLEYIKLTYGGDTAKAEALDGYKAGYIMLSIDYCETDGQILLPVTPKLKKSDVYASIADKNKEVEIRTATGASIYRNPKGKFVDTSRLYPEDEPTETMAFDPMLLSDALKAFKSDKRVEIEYRGELRPLVIKSDTAQAIVLPLRIG